MPLISLGWLSQVPIFRNYLMASTVSLLGSSIFDIAMPLYVWDRTHSPIALSLVSVSLALPYFLMAPFTGYAVDNFDNRRLMIFSDLGQVVLLAALFLFDILSSSWSIADKANTLWPIVLAVFLVKSCSIVFETVATFNLIPALVPETRLPEANTCFLTAQRTIQVVGPILGGLFMSLFGFRICTIINLLSFGATLYYVFHIKDLKGFLPERGPEHEFEGLSVRALFKSFYDSLRYIWSSPLFKPLILTMFFWNLSSLCPGTPSFTYYYRGVQAFSPAKFGLAVSVFGVLGVAGFLWAASLYKRVGFYRAFARSSYWQAALATISLFFFHHPILLTLVYGFSRISGSVISTGTFYLRQTEVPKHQVGAVNSSIRMHFMSAAPLSAVVQGVIIEHFGVGVSFALGAVCLWATAWYARKVALVYTSPKEVSLAA